MKQTDPQYKLRLPAKLKQQIEQAANASGRSMNAEIVARLTSSFEPQRGAMPWQVQTFVLDYAARHQVTEEQALVRLVEAGVNEDAPLVVFLEVTPDTTVAHLGKMLTGLAKLVPADAAVTVHRRKG